MNELNRGGRSIGSPNSPLLPLDRAEYTPEPRADIRPPAVGSVASFTETVIPPSEIPVGLISRFGTLTGYGMTDYCFPDVTVEELADKLLLGIYPHQISPKTRLRCQTFAIALKSLPQDDHRAKATGLTR